MYCSSNDRSKNRVKNCAVCLATDRPMMNSRVPFSESECCEMDVHCVLTDHQLRHREILYSNKRYITGIYTQVSLHLRKYINNLFHKISKARKNMIARVVN